MSGVMEVGMDGSGQGSRSGAPDGRPEGGREVRWSARRKEEVVLRLLRGEGLDALARETGQAAGTISAWREEFLAAGREGLKSRPRAGRGPAAGRGAAQDRRAVDGPRHPAGAATRRWTGALGRRGAERRETAGGPAGPGVPGRGGLQVGGVRAAPPTQRLGAQAPPRAGVPARSARCPTPSCWRAIRREIADVAVRRRGPPEDLRPAARCAASAPSRKRVLRLTREAGLLAPTPQVRKRAARLHDGTITVDVPDTLWATDADRGAGPRQRGPLRGVRDRRPRLRRGVGRRRAQDGPLGRRRPAAGGRPPSASARSRPAVAAGLALRYDGGPLLPLRSLPGRDRPPRHRPLAGLPLRARDQRLRREVRSRPSRSRCSGSSASTPSSSSAPRIRQFAADYNAALAARTPRLPHPTRGPRAPAPSGAPWHDRRVHQPGVR